MERVEYSEKQGGGGGGLSLSLSVVFFKERCVPNVLCRCCFCRKSGDTRSLKGFWDWIKDVLRGKGKEKVLKVIERNGCERNSLFLSMFHQTNLYSDRYLVLFSFIIQRNLLLLYTRDIFLKSIQVLFLLNKILQFVGYIIMICMDFYHVAFIIFKLLIDKLFRINFASTIWLILLFQKYGQVLFTVFTQILDLRTSYISFVENLKIFSINFVEWTNNTKSEKQLVRRNGEQTRSFSSILRSLCNFTHVVCGIYNVKYLLKREIVC